MKPTSTIFRDTVLLRDQHALPVLAHVQCVWLAAPSTSDVAITTGWVVPAPVVMATVVIASLPVSEYRDHERLPSTLTPGNYDTKLPGDSAPPDMTDMSAGGRSRKLD